MILNPTYLRALSAIQAPKKARHAHWDGVQVVQDAILNNGTSYTTTNGQVLTYTTTNGQVLVRVTCQTGIRSSDARLVWLDRATIKQIPSKATAEYNGEQLILAGDGCETRLTPTEPGAPFPDCASVISRAIRPGVEAPELNIWLDPTLCAGVLAACGKLGAETIHLEQPGGPGTPMVLTGTCGDGDTILALAMPERTPDAS
jgi:hypothetical protein